MCTDRKVVAAMGLKGQGYRPPTYYFFGAAQLAWSVLQSDCDMADQPQNVFSEGHIS